MRGRTNASELEPRLWDLLALGLELSWNKRVERPYRKHGIMPV